MMTATSRKTVQHFWLTTLLLCCASLFFWWPGTTTRTYAQSGPTTDPFPEKIANSGIILKVIDFITVPASNASAPKARITFVTHANDGSGRLFANDMRGKLYVIKSGAISLYLDLKNKFPKAIDTPGLGTGFAFFAFHPQFASNGKFYTIHSEGGAGLPIPDYLPQGEVTQHAVLVEWTAPNPSSDSFEAAGTSRQVLRIGFPSQYHNFQAIAFNPNAQPGSADYAKLYLSLGDGEVQSLATWTDVAQNLARPYGKILRIDPTGNNSANGQYGIPADNPFVGQAGKLGEIWVYGFRNPHRFSWDTGSTGKMILTNVGEKNIESVYLGIKGANYGWNEREGEYLFKKDDSTRVYPLPANDAILGYTYPVAMYDHDEGRGIVGGFVYRGAAIPELQGKYLFGDIVNGRLFVIDERAITEQAALAGNNATVGEVKLINSSGTAVTLLDLVKSEFPSANRVDLRFGVDAAGELFVSSKQVGKVWRLVCATEKTTPTVTLTGSVTPSSTVTDPASTPTPTATATITGTLILQTPSVTPCTTPPTVTATITVTASATVTGSVTATTTQMPTAESTPRPVNYLPVIAR